MTLHDLIFSKRQPERLLRHLAFWVAQSFFWVFWASFFFYRTWEWIFWGFRLHGYFILEMAYTYFIAYYLAPKFLYPKQYSRFALYALLLTLITYPLYVIIQFIVHETIRLPRDQQLLHAWYSSMNFLITGPPVICGLFLTVKMLKNYYLKMQEKETAIKESANAELQLLKAQIHPHFLFNTLNNIYSFNLDRSPAAADLVLKLSHTLKYMVNDCDAALVPLEKELKMLRDYVGLEKVRYGKRLNIITDITGQVNKLIAPLLIIPFVENSFKHGASKMLEHPWIIIGISVQQSFLQLKISNSKPVTDTPANAANGIGLKNVRKRLELLYPRNYQLDIKSEQNAFHVELTLPLEDASSTSVVAANPSKGQLTYTYAE